MLGQALPARAADQKLAQRKLKVALFSKHLQFLAGEKLARTVADIGFDAIDITVRKRHGGHIDPARVRQDLPPLVGFIRKHGLEVSLLATDTVDVESPYLEDILQTMKSLGLRNYRFGNMRYAEGQPYPAQLEQMKSRVAKLVALNKRYQACALYHIESGARTVGSSVLDLYMLLKDFDPQYVGITYDLEHAVEAGGGGSWMNSFRFLGPHVLGIAVKDFDWAKDASGIWRPQLKPLGEGSIPMPQFFAMVAESSFSGPVEIQFEYLMGGEKDSEGTGVVDRQAVYSGMKRDLGKVRGYLAQAHL
jgi:sugar phosphate isomerase/epimerase